VAHEIITDGEEKVTRREGREEEEEEEEGEFQEVAAVPKNGGKRLRSARWMDSHPW
jgi:hypothetical protein